MRNLWMFLVPLSLTACGDPLANFERIEDVELATEEPVAQALPEAGDTSPTDGLLSRILRGPTAAAPIAQSPVAQSPVVQSPEAESSVIDAAVASVVAPEEPKGLRGWLRSAAKAGETPAIAAPGSIEAETADPIAETANTEIAAADVEEPITASVEPEKRRGLLGILKPVENAPETVRTASLDPDTFETPKPVAMVEPKKRRGLFGDASREQSRDGPDAQDVTFGTVLPYGQIARVCKARNRELGRRVDQAPAGGRKYSLYDSNPKATGGRTFYITGFKDNCPRQFTAALALFGSPRVHEQLRYGRPSNLYPYSTTDKAYEKVKSSICKVRKSKPCGTKMVLLERSTTFISTYEKFTDNARWSDILLHKGTVVAAAIKKP